MSVFTSIDRLELEAFLQNYQVGNLRDFQGIPSGIENTNYFVGTGSGEYVLTLFEKLTAAELPFFLDLMAFLAEHRVPCPHPIPSRTGRYLAELKGKPTALVQRLYGSSIENPAAIHCAAVGRALAQLHQAGAEFAKQRENDHGLPWWKKTAHALTGKLAPEDGELLREELHFQHAYRFSGLPSGVIHADLFRDNALFEGGELRGIIDFYYACTDTLLFDIAVTVNDWCSNGEGELDEARARSLLRAYHAVRALNADEHRAWPVMLRAAASRFWLSRLYDLHFPRAGEITHSKDPRVFKRILLHRIHNERHLHI
jgi:homoserine kinase type II